MLLQGRGENMPERKVASTGDRTHNHQVMSVTCLPLSHPGRASGKVLSGNRLMCFGNTPLFSSLYTNMYHSLLHFIAAMHSHIINPLPDDKVLDWSKLKQIADDILKCILNRKWVPFRVKNIVRKGEIACYKQFLLLSKCFPQLYIFCALKCGLVW